MAGEERTGSKRFDTMISYHNTDVTALLAADMQYRYNMSRPITESKAKRPGPRNALLQSGVMNDSVMHHRKSRQLNTTTKPMQILTNN